MRKASSLTLRLGIFFYDSLRVFFLLALLAGVTGDPSGPGGMFQGAPDGIRFPYILYAAPNALFPLISLFLLIRPGESAAFIPLYITGKAISIAALAGWVFFAFLKLRSLPPFILLFFCLGAADITAAAGTALLNFTLRKNAAEGPVQAADGEGEKQCTLFR
ncbi:MAG: hypothetical protein LBP69_09285 [Treponema sp.]|jgi:hypothetical protein|nr:hypothetical protein [Treponema sp.]